jgi:hypothetical protein
MLVVDASVLVAALVDSGAGGAWEPPCSVIMSSHRLT